MANDQSNPKLRAYADALIGLETTINYVLERMAQEGVQMKLESEIVNLAHFPSRIHLRLVTPDMEVRDDVSTNARKASVRSTSREASG